MIVTDEELDAVKIESTHTVDIEKFVPRSRDRSPLHGRALLHRPRGQGCAGAFRRHSRRHAQQGRWSASAGW